MKFGRGGGVYSYNRREGVRCRFVYRRSDGTQTSKRGFASQRAARDARRRSIEQVERGEVRHTKETFGAYWDRWLAQRRPYLEAGTWTGYTTNGRKRLVPVLGHLSLGELTVQRVRDFVADLAQAVEAGDLAVKTVNNTLVTLVVCLNHAVDDGLIPPLQRSASAGSPPLTSNASTCASMRSRDTSTHARRSIARWPSY